jgi:hypothetical protein
MKNYRQIISKVALGMILVAMFALVGSVKTTFAQESDSAKKQSNVQPKSNSRDPFTVYAPPPRAGRNAPVIVSPPSIQDRISAYKAQKAASMSLRQPVPKPTTALLLSELQVVGVFRTPRGYAAMVEATPIKLNYVIHPGEMFYDGQLVAIEENRLVFRREVKWTDGRKETAVDTKPLRTPNAVADAMTATKAPAPSSPASSTPAESAKPTESKPEKAPGQ